MCQAAVMELDTFACIAQQERLLVLGDFEAAADDVQRVLSSGHAGALLHDGLLLERLAFVAVQAFVSCGRNKELRHVLDSALGSLNSVPLRPFLLWQLMLVQAGSASEAKNLLENRLAEQLAAAAAAVPDPTADLQGFVAADFGLPHVNLQQQSDGTSSPCSCPAPSPLKPPHQQQQELVALCRCYALDVLCDGLAAFDEALDWLQQGAGPRQQSTNHHTHHTHPSSSNHQENHHHSHHHHHHHHHHDPSGSPSHHTPSSTETDTPSAAITHPPSVSGRPLRPALPSGELLQLLDQVKARRAAMQPHHAVAQQVTSPATNRLLPSTPSRSERLRHSVSGMDAAANANAAPLAATAMEAGCDEVFTMTGELNDPDDGLHHAASAQLAAMTMGPTKGGAAGEGARGLSDLRPSQGPEGEGRPLLVVQPLLPSLLSGVADGTGHAAQALRAWARRLLGGAEGAGSPGLLHWLLWRGGWKVAGLAVAAAIMAFAAAAESRAAGAAVARRWRQLHEAVRRGLGELLGMGLALTPQQHVRTG